jgi:hypothetical protein
MVMRPLWFTASLVLAAAGGWMAGCGGNNASNPFGDDGGNTGDGGAGVCNQCGTSQDCASGQVCAKFPGDNYCIESCDNGQACSGGATCMAGGDYAGNPVNGCVPTGECAGSQGDDGGGGGRDSGVAYDAGNQTQPTGTVGPNGGSLSRLLFGVVGDTRPANYDDVGGYPTAIITQIFKDLQAQNPKPPFIVSTGDYQFASSGNSSTSGQQLDIYEQALSNYTGIQFPAMGNHECTGATASNCGPSSSNGMTANYNAFMSKMLAPIQKTLPYYSININAVDNSWTSKFVFVAANAWNTAQQSWLQSTLAQQTTYTFVMRHEPSDAPTAPGVTPSDQILAQSAYTLLIVGHSHTYGHYSSTPKVALVGNGGAPLSSSSKNYGYAIMSQRQDGAIVADMIDYQSGKADSYFHFAVKPDGTPTN